MYRWLLVPLLALALTLVACGSDSPPASDSLPSDGGSKGTTSGQPAGLGSSEFQPTSERMVVRDAQLALAFDDVAQAAERIEDVAEAHGGRVESSHITGDGTNAMGTVVLRVPSQSFSQAVDDIKALARRVESEETSSDDVTDEYVDLDAQVRNLQATEAQLQTLMERANSITEVLRVQGELTGVREQIEKLQGRMQLLAQTAAASLITVTMTPAVIERSIVSETWSFAQTVRSATRGLVAVLQVVADVGTWVVVLFPIWGPVNALLFIAARKGWLTGQSKPLSAYRHEQPRNPNA